MYIKGTKQYPYGTKRFTMVLTPKTKSKRLAALYGVVIEAKERGCTDKEIVEYLKEDHNLDLSLPTFKKYLHRMRSNEIKVGIPQEPKKASKKTLTPQKKIEEKTTPVPVKKPVSGVGLKNSLDIDFDELEDLGKDNR